MTRYRDVLVHIHVTPPDTGDEPLSIPCDGRTRRDLPGVAITPEYRQDKGFSKAVFAITHIRTGQKISAPLNALTDERARAFMDALVAVGCDFTMSDPVAHITEAQRNEILRMRKEI